MEHEQIVRELKEVVRDVPDFPIKGILFRDITPILKNPKTWRMAIDLFVDRYRDEPVDAFAGIESRGFLFAAPLALELGISCIPIRKEGKLPAAKVRRSYALEYGEATIEIHKDAVQPGDKIVIIDDLLATGGTACAASELIEEVGGVVHDIAFLIELDALEGRKKLGSRPVTSFLHY